MFHRSLYRTFLIALSLCTFLTVAAQADPPAFAPLKQTSDGHVEVANTVKMPFPGGHEEPAGPLGRIVTRDMRTGEVTIRDEVTRDEFLSEYLSPGGDGVLVDPYADPPDKNFSWWSIVGDPASGINPMHVKVRICSAPPCMEPYGGGCSGTLIDPLHVLTAGHCVYSWSAPNLGWVEDVTVHPGYDSGDGPWGHAHVVQSYSWEGWTVDEDHHHDIAILVLDRPLGALVGWRGYGYNDDCDWYYGGSWTHHAYPQESPYDGESMYANAGTFDDCWSDYGLDLHIAYWDNPTWGGASGCGGVRDNAVFAIFRGSDRVEISESALITDTKFNDIRSVRFQNMPDTPDLRPMYVQVEADNFDPGDQLDSFSFVLVNYAEAGLNTSVVCHFYLSTDTNITAGDHYVDSEVVSVNLPPMGAQTVGMWPPPMVPASLTSGQYYMGVILDYADAIPGNNTTGVAELDSITVDCETPGRPEILSPSEGEICQPLARTIDWDDQLLIQTYELQLGTWCGGGSVIDVGSGSQHTVTGLANGVTYYARVRAKRYCGAWSSWSSCRSFTTVDIPTSDVAFLTPDEADVCHDPDLTTISWSPVPGASRYYLRVGETCGSGPTYGLLPDTPYKDVTGLQPATVYHYQVQVRGECLNWGSWSECGTFKTAPVVVDPPILTAPPDGSTCEHPETALYFPHIEDPDHYEIQVGTACGTGTVYESIGNGIEPAGLETGVVYYWRARAFHVCGLISDWTPCWSFSLNLEPPLNPTFLESNSHTIGVWSHDDTINTWWDFGYDTCEGAWVHYGWVFDNDPATEPIVQTSDMPELTLTTSDPLPDADDHWFHLRAVDMAGNWAVDTMHLGPFWIDANAPSDVVITRVSLPAYQWGDYGVLSVDWNPSTDGGSGVAGYSYVLDGGGSTPNGDVDTTLETVTLPLSYGTWTFRIAAIDVATNMGSVSSIGTFFHNASLPAFLVPSAGQDVPEGELLQIQWEEVIRVNGGTLHLSLNGGQTFTQIAVLTEDEVESGGPYPWLAPAESTDEAVFMLDVDAVASDYTACSALFSLRVVTEIDEDVPEDVGTALAANYPNPFNPRTTIAYTLADETRVRITVLDALGRRVRTLVDWRQTGPGRHEVDWDGRNAQGLRVSSGLYFSCLETIHGRELRRMVLVK